MIFNVDHCLVAKKSKFDMTLISYSPFKIRLAIIENFSNVLLKVKHMYQRKASLQDITF